MRTFYFVFLILILINTKGVSQGNWQWVTGTPTTARIDDIYFINDSVGFFGSNAPGTSGVYKTVDKGDNWNLIYPVTSSFIRSIEFINDSVGFYGLLSGAQSTPGSLFKTEDGGLTWNRLQNMQMTLYDGICGLAHYGNSLIAVGTYSTPAWFYRTTDFGLTWVKTDLSAFASGLVDCYMVNNDTILVSGIGDSMNQNKATILKSFDGGTTWQRVFLSSAPTSYCWKMFFRPGGVGLASVEMGSAVARTTDFGTTWTEIPVNNPPGYDLGAIGLLNDTLGWVTSQTNLGYTATWETHDGGLSWDSIYSVVEMGDRMVVVDSVTTLISGKGIFKYVFGTAGTQPPIAAGSKLHDLIIYPNPVAENVNIEAIAGSNTFGLLDILDQKGLLVQHITRQVFTKGKHSFSVSVKNLPAANYKLLWRTNEIFLSKDFVVVK